ncbi:ArgP/LysG family DNA-binding transcriptional regulator [Humibacillus xanthopallidus]|uniref:HTH-type transcriptional regulator LysG n=1 Tax=Humibacillus xanthopallidus TaxID=412689 RepID=A0A543I303_9MICO|nr:ArgP/LysG family DNA-binding transcriptional regulator [Humibacillus xanthopallidus]TQM64974.1 LysR family transcriptional regulator (chromosome initiation inhibitor) [Humibacillus xanthopallidus]
MRLQTDQLAALLAIVDTGTFEAAARRLHVTPSAVSQRVKALESEVGHVLVVRAAPCRATPTGEALVRLARQQALLAAETVAELAPRQSERIDLAVAVNADSMATWFGRVIAGCAVWDDVVLRLRVEDQDHSARLLRSGEVLGAVTSDPTPVQGCSTEPLVTMRYLPAATPALVERHRTRRGVGWATMPVVRFNDKDDLQQRILDRHGVVDAPPTHEVPDGAAFVAAVVAGLGWGALLSSQLSPLLERGDLVRLGSRDHVDVPLYWQRWRLPSTHLDRLSDLVRRESALAGLRPRRGG